MLDPVIIKQLRQLSSNNTDDDLKISFDLEDDKVLQEEKIDSVKYCNQIVKDDTYETNYITWDELDKFDFT